MAAPKAPSEDNGRRLAVLEVKLDTIEAKQDEQGATLREVAKSMSELVRFEYEARALATRIDAQDKKLAAVAADVATVKAELPTLTLARNGAGVLAKVVMTAVLSAVLGGVIVKAAPVPSVAQAAATGQK